MKALVTGSTGFIGRHIVRELLERGWAVRCLVRDRTRESVLDGFPVEIIEGDIRSFDAIERAFHGVDIVFHTAAKVSDWGEWKDFSEITVGGTKNCLRASICNSVQRFLHVSTVDVYDRSHFKHNLPRVVESSSLVSDSDPFYYARAKMLAERAVMQYHDDGTLAVSIIRPATVYGPGDRAILPRLIDYLRSSSAVWIGRFDPVLGLVHVNDVVDLCIMAACAEQGIGQTFNAASGEDVRLKQFIRAICSALTLPEPQRAIPYPVALSIAWLVELCGRLCKHKFPPPITRTVVEFFTTDQCFDVSKAKDVLGWRPIISFDDGISSALSVLIGD